MSAPRIVRSPRKATVLVLATCLLLLPLFAASTAKAEPAAPSLAIVPQDAAFYTSSMRIGEQIEIVKNSKWWEKINEWDLVAQMKFMAQFALQNPGNPAGQFQQFFDQPENQQLLAVLKDMISTEMFCYGDAGVGDALGLGVEITNSMRFGPMFYQLLGSDSGLSEDEFMARMVLDSLMEQEGKLNIPNMVLGFKLSDEKTAATQLQRLEDFIKLMLDNNPDLAIIRDKFSRTDVDGSEFLTLELDGSLVPWDEVPFEELEEVPGEYDELKAKLQELTVTVSLGIHKGYAMISAGKSNEHLAQLGNGDVLADHPKLAALNDVGTQQFTDIAFVSEDLISQVGTKPQDIDDLVELADELLPLADELPDEAKTELAADARALGDDLKKFVPQQGPQLLFSYMTDRGFETFRYSWSENFTLDGAKPLTLIDHLGGSPLFALLARGQHHPEYYDILVKWMKKGHGYFEKYGLPTMSDREREQYDTVARIAIPLLTKMDEVNRKMMIPALAEGQSALVIDGGLKAKQWHMMQPPLTEPIALPSPAIVLGLKDADLFRKALTEYRGIFNEAMKSAHQLNPGEVPDFQLPTAKVRQLDNGTEVYYYTLPPEFGVYDRVAPNVAINDDFAAFSLAPRHTMKLVTATPLAVDGGPAADIAAKPLAAVTYFNFAAMIDMIEPWANEGVRMYARNMQANFGDFEDEPADGDSEMAKQILSQVSQGADFLRAFRGYSSITYVKDDAIVTHGEIRITDLD